MPRKNSGNNSKSAPKTNGRYLPNRQRRALNEVTHGRRSFGEVDPSVLPPPALNIGRIITRESVEELSAVVAYLDAAFVQCPATLLVKLKGDVANRFNPNRQAGALEKLLEEAGINRPESRQITEPLKVIRIKDQSPTSKLDLGFQDIPLAGGNGSLIASEFIALNDAAGVSSSFVIGLKRRDPALPAPHMGSSLCRKRDDFTQLNLGSSGLYGLLPETITLGPIQFLPA